MSEQDTSSQNGFFQLLLALLEAFGGDRKSDSREAPSAGAEDDLLSPGIRSLLGGSFGGVTLSPSAGIPENTSGQYQLYAQMTGTRVGPEGYPVATGVMTLVSPNGEKQTFAFDSGAGKNLAKNMLPGLCGNDLNGNEVGTATFGIDNASVQVDSKSLPAGMLGENGRGNWLRLISDPSQTSRGGTVSDTKGFLGIHNDGGRTGTAGCLGMSDEQSTAFFSALQDIPAAQRPKQLVVLSPEAREPDRDVNIGNGLAAALRSAGLSPRLP
ncbi:MAG: hypothetical protein U1E36_07185 [Rickettsiales bacterium]